MTARIAQSLQKTYPGLEVTRRDLGAEPLPHLDGRMLAGMAADVASHPAGRAEPDPSLATLKEFQKADIVVIGAPMYNFSISSQLKAWIDRIVVAGKTFTYTADGPKGLAGGKTVIVASARGGLYAPGTPQAAMDFQENYLRAIFRFIGVEDIRFIRAEGIAMGPDRRKAALEAALAAAETLNLAVPAAKAA
jgi:FMN-dependent NADH-azoreductase